MKHYLYTLLILALFSCDKEEPEKPNTSPKAFEVTANAEGTNVTLIWTEAVDADGDAVTYAVVYGDTLAKGLTARTHTIKNLPYETEISGTVVASDGKGGKTEQGFKVKTGEQIYVLIPDREFERYLVQNFIDDEVDGKVLVSKVREVRIIGFMGYNILDLEGLQYFENLEYLYFSGQSLEEIILPKLPSLTYLGLDNCKKLVKLDLKNVKTLEYIMGDGNKINSIDTQHNIHLKEIRILGMRTLEVLNVKNSPKLERLNVTYSNLREVDLSNNRNLTLLVLESHNLEKVNLLNNSKLNTISLSSYNLTDLVLPMESKNLIELAVNTDKLKNNIDIDRFENLKMLYLDGINLKTFEANKFPELNFLNLHNNKLETVKLGKLLKLEYLIIHDNLLKDIDLSGCPNMIRLDLSNNQLKSLNLCSQELLNEVHIGGDGNVNLSEVYVKEAVRRKVEWKKWSHTAFKVCD